MKPSGLILIFILFFCTAIFGQTEEKETPQKFRYGVTLMYYHQYGRSEQVVIECPLKDEECLLLNGADDVNTIFNLVDKILDGVLPEGKRGKRFDNGFLPFHSGGSARRYDLYEHVKISIGVARHPKPHLGWIIINWEEAEITPVKNL